MIEDEAEFFEKFEARARQFADRVVEGDLPKAYAALELIMSIYSARELDTERLFRAFPVENWRDETIAVPTALLRPIVKGWMKYRRQAGKQSLEKALGIAAQTKGASSVVKTEKTTDRNRSLSNAAVLDYVASHLEGQPVSLDAVFAGVAEECGCKASAVETAYKEHGQTTIAALEEAGFLKLNWKDSGGKT